MHYFNILPVMNLGVLYPLALQDFNLNLMHLGPPLRTKCNIVNEKGCLAQHMALV